MSSQADSIIIDDDDNDTTITPLTIIPDDDDATTSTANTVECKLEQMDTVDFQPSVAAAMASIEPLQNAINDAKSTQEIGAPVLSQPMLMQTYHDQFAQQFEVMRKMQEQMQQHMLQQQIQMQQHQHQQLPLQNTMANLKRKRLLSSSSSSSASSSALSIPYNNANEQQQQQQQPPDFSSINSLPSSSSSCAQPPNKIRVVVEGLIEARPVIMTAQPPPPSLPVFNADNVGHVNRDFDIDSSPLVQRLETEFLSSFGREMIVVQPDTMPEDRDASVVYSRALKTYYLWPKSAMLPITRLKSTFQRTGHTFSIDYTRTYNRMFALDLDCICRTKALTDVEHLNANQVHNVCQVMLDAICSELKFSLGRRKSLEYSVWRNKCNFHIYTNIRVSLLTHLEICQKLAAQFTQHHFVIEVPDMMPLPCSAKILNEPYCEHSTSRVDFNNDESLTVYEPFTFHDQFEISPVCIAERTVASISTSVINAMITNSNNLYINKVLTSKLPLAAVPAFSSVNNIINSIKINTQQFPHMRQFDTYITHVTNTHQKRRRQLAEIEEANAANNPSPSAPAPLDESGIVDFADFEQETLTKYLAFIEKFYDCFKIAAQPSQTTAPTTPIENANNNDDNDDDNNESVVINRKYKRPTLFVRISAIMYGGLHMQHFVSMLFHALDIQLDNFENFKKLLYAIYGQKLVADDPVVAQFLSTVNIDTFLEYALSAEEMFEYLAFLYQWNVDPAHSFQHQLELLMQCQLNVSKPSEYCKKIEESLAEKDGRGMKRADALIKTAVLKFIDILKMLRYMFYDHTTKRIYVLVDGIYYDSEQNFKDNMVPLLIRDYIGTSTKATNSYNCEIKNKPQALYANGSITLDNSHFMFSTRVGVFNSVTGLYSSSTCFLQFNKFRDVGIWTKPVGENVRLIVKDYRQNYDIMEMRQTADKFVKNIDNVVFKLYAYFIMVPAVIQLRYVVGLEQYKLTKIFNILNSFDGRFECIYFLVEYFPFPPEYVYWMAELCTNIGFLETLSSYDRLCNLVFKHNCVTSTDWSEKFNSMFGDVAIAYDKDAPTYMDKLKTLNHPLIKDNPNNCLIYVLLLVCIIKCDTYAPLITGFNMKMPDCDYNHPDFADAGMKTCRKNMADNLDRARRLVFGDKVSHLEAAMINELLSLCISVDFQQDQLQNLLAMLGATHVPYNKSKKLFLFYGSTNVGKSFICSKLLRMMGPKVLSVVNFADLYNRAVLSEHFLINLSELSKICPTQFKAITGNDEISAKRFFNQTYDMQRNQPHMFGATNVHLDFNGSAMQQQVDRTTINRLYVIKLTGEQMEPNRNEPNFFSMMTNSQYFPDLFPSKKIETWGLCWITYMYYVQNRDASCYAILKNTSEASKVYKNYTYYRNNTLYRFLVRSNLVDEPGFFISANRIMQIAKENLDKTSKEIGSLEQFLAHFNQQYNVQIQSNKNAETTTVVHNIQESGFVQHVKYNMAVHEEANASITKADILARTSVYLMAELRENASHYFETQNESYYNYKTGVYTGITFTTTSLEYDSNSIAQNSASRAQDSNSSASSLIVEHVD